MNNAYNIMDELENNKLIKRLKDLKKIIKNDKTITKLIKDFELAKENYEKYNLKEDLIKKKSELVKNEIINEYISIQNEINLLTMKINKRINMLINDKKSDN